MDFEVHYVPYNRKRYRAYTLAGYIVNKIRLKYLICFKNYSFPLNAFEEGVGLKIKALSNMVAIIVLFIHFKQSKILSDKINMYRKTPSFKSSVIHFI